MTVDANNGTLGIGDGHCWNNPGEEDEVECLSEQCFTDILAEWRPKGGLLYTLTRGCVKNVDNFDDEITCVRGGSLDSYQRRGKSQ